MASSWVETPGRGIAKYPFTANDSNQLTLKVGDILEVKQENGGWFRGYLVGGPPTLRLFPKSYVEFTPQSEIEEEAPPPPPDTPQPVPTPTTSARGSDTHLTQANALAADASPQLQAQQGHMVSTPTSQLAGTGVLGGQFNTMRTSQTVQASAASPIPFYNPEPKPKAVTAAPQQAQAPAIYVPTIHSDFKDQEHGYFLLRSPNQSPYNPEISNILEVVDGHRLVDPISSQDMLVDENNIPLRNLTESSNDPLIQLRHAQHQSLTLSIEPALRDDGTSNSLNAPTQAFSGHSSTRHSVNTSSTKKKTAEVMNVATPEVTNAVYPAMNTSLLYGSGDNSCPPKRYQLFLQVNVCIFSVNEWTELFFSLYSVNKGSYITEDYVVRLPPPGLPEHGTILGRMKTVFRDLDPDDLKSDLWLVCRIYRIGSLQMDKKEAKKKDEKKGPDQLTRRAFGCAATYISDAELHLQLGKKYEPPPNQLTIYVPAVEHVFPKFHDMLIQRAKGKIKADSRDFETVPKAKGIALCLTLFQGEINQVRDQNRSMLREVGDTLKTRFPLYWDVRQTRNDLYVTLHELFAIQDKKASPRNIEIRISLINKYAEVPNAIYRGSGEEPLTTYITSVYYHNNNPSFGETFRIRVPANVLSESHLYFELWHISTNPKKSAIFSAAVMPLTTDTGAFIENKEHSITTCKPFARDEAYLSDLHQSRMVVRKGETIRLTTQLISTSLTPNPVLTSLAGWKITSRQILLSNLQTLMLSRTASVDIQDLRHNFKELIHTLLAVISSNAHVDVHVYAIEALMFILSRLAQDSVPMLETYCQYLVTESGSFHKILGYLVGTLANHTTNIVQSVAAANNVGGSASPPHGSISLADQRPSIMTSSSGSGGQTPSVMPVSPSHTTRTHSVIPSSPMGPSRLNFDDTNDFQSMTMTQQQQQLSTNSGNLASQQLSMDTDHPPFIRFTLALPYMMRITASIFTLNERKGAKTAALQRTTTTVTSSSQPSSPSTIIQPIDSDINRDDFKKYYLQLFAHINEILEQHLQPDKHRTIQQAQSILLRSYASLLNALTISSTDTSLLSGIFTAEESQELIIKMLAATANHPSLALDQLLSLQALITGVTGFLQPPLDVLSTVMNHGWHRHTITFARSWFYLPRVYRSRVIETAQLKALLPQFIATISDAVTISLKRSSLSETYSAVILAQHFYSIAYAHTYRTPEEVESHPIVKNCLTSTKSSITTDSANTANLARTFNPTQSIYCTDFLQLYPINPDAMDTTRVAFTDLLPLLPPLVNALAYYTSSYPCMHTPKTDASLQTNFNLIDPRATNVAFVDFLPDIALLIFGITKQVNEDEFMAFIRQLPAEQTSLFMNRLLFVCNALSTYRLFPSQWITLEMYQISSIVHILKFTARVLREIFLGFHFNNVIWVYWFQLALECQQSPLLISELQPIVRKVFITEHYGALRESIGELFQSMWGDLDKRSQRLCIEPFVEKLLHYACNSIVNDVKTTALHIYFDLLKAEYELDGNFNESERCTIDACYEITNTSPERGSMATALLLKSMNDRFENHTENEQLRTDGLQFLSHLDNLFSLMSSLFNFPEDPAYESDRTSVALRLIKYIEQTNQNMDSNVENSAGRKAMHSRYIQYLVDLHLNNGNYMEAGITLVQQAKLLDWSHTIMDAYDDYPMETETLRKERLLKAAISSFARAQDFERCIAIIDYLRYYYQMVTFDYKTLSMLIQQQATFFQQIITTRRVYEYYFRVVFYGFNEPTFENGNEYVYRGNTLEPVLDFTNRLKARYSDAYFHNSAEKPSDELLAQHKRIVSISSPLNIPTVEEREEILAQSRYKPAKKNKMSSNGMISWQFEDNIPNKSIFSSDCRPLDAPSHAHSTMPTSVAIHRNYTNIRVMEYSRPWRRTDEKNPSNEFKHLWLIRNYVILEEAFPSNRRRIPIVDRIEQIIKPIQFGVENINKKTQELLAIMAEVNQTPVGDKPDVRKLSMTLNGMVDAAVNGGNKNYIDAFLTPEFTTPESVTLEDERIDIQHTLQERRRWQQELKSALKNQLEVVKEGLFLYGQKGDESQLGLYEHLLNMYNRSAQSMAELFDQ